MNSTLNVAAAVAAGAAWLDKHYPGWVEKVDLSTLNMSSSVDCVAGQVLGGYDLLWNDHGMEMAERANLGFTDAGYYWGWDALGEAWMQVIDARRVNGTFTVSEPMDEPEPEAPAPLLSDHEAATLLRGVAAGETHAATRLLLLLTGRPESDYDLVSALF